MIMTEMDGYKGTKYSKIYELIERMKGEGCSDTDKNNKLGYLFTNPG